MMFFLQAFGTIGEVSGGGTAAGTGGAAMVVVGSVVWTSGEAMDLGEVSAEDVEVSGEDAAEAQAGTSTEIIATGTSAMVTMLEVITTTTFKTTVQEGIIGAADGKCSLLLSGSADSIDTGVSSTCFFTSDDLARYARAGSGI